MLRTFFLLTLLPLLGYAPAANAGRDSAASLLEHPTDTVVVRLPNQAVLTLMVRDAAQLRQLKNYHLDSLTTRLASYIKQAEAAAQAATSNKVTMEFYPDKDQPGQNLPEQIRITTSKKAPNASRVDVALNKKFGVNVTTDADGNKTYDIGSDKAKAKAKLSPADSARHADGADRHVVDLRFDIGLNTFVKRAANATGQVPSLSTWGSNYVNFGLDYIQPLVYRKRSKLALTLGPELSINNFELQGSNVWVERDGITVAERAPDAMQISGARLRVTTLNLPAMLALQLRNTKGKRTLSVGVGGFAGYRLSSSSRVQYKLAGSDYEHEDVVSGPFHLNNWQYGVQGEIGFHALTLFAKYNLNDMFQENKGPQAQVLSFGLRVFGF